MNWVDFIILAASFAGVAWGIRRGAIHEGFGLWGAALGIMIGLRWAPSCALLFRSWTGLPWAGAEATAFFFFFLAVALPFDLLGAGLTRTSAITLNNWVRFGAGGALGGARAVLLLGALLILVTNVTPTSALSRSLRDSRLVPLTLYACELSARFWPSERPMRYRLYMRGLSPLKG